MAHGSVPASLDKNNAPPAVRGSAPIQAPADASQALGASHQSQPVAARPGLQKRKADAVVVNRHSDPSIWILDANTHRGRVRVPYDVGDGFLDAVGDLAQHAARDLQVVALLGPEETAVRGSQHGFGIAACLLQRTDAALKMPDAISERARAIHRPTGGALQD